MTKAERIQNISNLLENAKANREKNMRAGKFKAANKWAAEMVRYSLMLKRIEQEE